jgi:hypothetical protein
MFLTTLALIVFLCMLVVFIMRTSTLNKNVEILQDCVHDCVTRDEMQSLIAKYLQQAMSGQQ